MLTPGDIKEIRTRAGENQTQFAERLGINQATLSRWEKNGLPSRGAGRRAVEMLAEVLREAAE